MEYTYCAKFYNGGDLPVRLDRDFYSNSDVVEVAKDLIGKVLYSQISGHVTAGLITETEAYCGLTDKACHAYLNKHTNRTQIFYNEGGLAYVYLCYGIHKLFNIITGLEHEPKAVLIRSIMPTLGVGKMYERRKLKNSKVKLSKLCDGPGKLTQAMGIELTQNGISLTDSETIWIEDVNVSLPFKATPRIGIDYAGEDALLPWRFLADNNKISNCQRGL